MQNYDPDKLLGNGRVQTQMIELAIQHVHVSHTLDPKTLDLLVSRAPYPYFQDIVLDLVGKIAAYRGKQRATVKWPATWWDHLKDRVKKIWWLERALARLSVRYEEQTFHASLLLPSVEFPPLGTKLRYSYRIIEEEEPD